MLLLALLLLAGELCWHNDSADGGEDSVSLPAV